MAAIGLRAWTLDLNDYEGDEAAFAAAVQHELAMSQHLCDRLGIGLVSTPIRALYPDGHGETRGWRFETVTIPAARMPATATNWQPALLEDEPDEEPEAVEPEMADVSY